MLISSHAGGRLWSRRLVLVALVLATLAAAVSGVAAQDPPPQAMPTPTPTLAPPGAPTATPVIPIPPPVELLEDDDAIQNILLLGTDVSSSASPRTDVMVVVSINQRARSVALWHIPRDLFVYIPGHTMDRINLAYLYGQEDPDGDGPFALLQETFRYNFGLAIDHYALVNFLDFQSIIGQLGGLRISVDCAIQDWRLIDPALDPTVAENWEEYTLPIGRHTLSPYMALWYVRSRKTTSDFDRGRRQIDVLRAIWQQAREDGLIEQITELWPELVQTVETDMSLSDVLAYVPLALALDPAQMARYGGAQGTEYQRFFTPDDGRDVQLPVRDALLPMLRDFVTPPTESRLARRATTIEVVDASYLYYGFEQVAADRLAWEGFAISLPEGEQTVRREGSVIYDYTGLTKGSPLPDLLRILRIDDAAVIPEPDPNRTVDFRVEIGQTYNACVVQGDAIEDASAAPDDLTATPAACWLRFTAEVNMRLGPGTDYPVLDTTAPGLSAPVTGRTEDGAWWQARYDGQVGWFAGTISTVETIGECDDVPVATP